MKSYTLELNENDRGELVLRAIARATMEAPSMREAMIPTPDWAHEVFPHGWAREQTCTWYDMIRGDGEVGGRMALLRWAANPNRGLLVARQTYDRARFMIAVRNLLDEVPS